MEKMETITFYSYKGGTGRSLLTTQLAACLAWFGKSVCLLDFDFEAPGLHHKLGLLYPKEKFKFDWGFIDYSNEFVKKAERKIDVCSECGQKMRDEAPDAYTVDKMETIWRKMARFPYGDGVIHLLPAGDVLAPNNGYWEIISNPDWQRFMYSSELSRDFLLKLKILIEKELNPNYLLIDSRSGVNEFSGICTRLLAKKVVFVTIYHNEGLEGTSSILKSFEDARTVDKFTPKFKDTYVVLSRIPQFYYDRQRKYRWFTDEQSKNMQQAALTQINLKLESKFSRFYPLRSDPLLEISEFLPMSFAETDVEKTILPSQLTLDYIHFFSELIGDEIGDQLDKYTPEVQKFRPYLLEEQFGKLINPEDDSWNVAFRVETMVSMLNSIFVDIFEREKLRTGSEEEAEKIASEALFTAGKSAAGNFSKYLHAEWERERKTTQKTPSYITKLNYWCKFDSTVGFGKFENRTWGDAKEGNITIVNNFLLNKRDKGEHNLCAFFRGYITCILEAIFDVENIKVVHILEKDCGQYQESARNTCVFRFEIT